MQRYLGSTYARILALVGLLLFAMWAFSAMGGARERGNIAQVSGKTKTVCVGRFLIDMPHDAQVSLSGGSVDGFKISNDPSETESAFITRLAKREAEINAEKNELGKKSLESVQGIKEEGKIGKIFVFGRSSTYVYHGQQKIDLTSVSVNGYVRTGGVSYNFIANAYDPATAGNLRKLLRQLRPRADHEIPPEPGFCLDRGFIRDPLTAEQLERVVMFAGLPGHPDLNIAFSTMAGTKSGSGLLARDTEANAQLPALFRMLIRTFRKSARTINGLAGEELAQKVREMNRTTTYGFDWEMGGTENDVLVPFLTLELQSGINPRAGDKPVQSSLSEAALIDLWDRISSSIRLRPTSPLKTVSANHASPAAVAMTRPDHP